MCVRAMCVCAVRTRTIAQMSPAHGFHQRIQSSSILHILRMSTIFHNVTVDISGYISFA